MAKDLEELTKDTPIKHPGIQARVEASITRSQVAELVRALEELGELMDVQWQEERQG